MMLVFFGSARTRERKVFALGWRGWRRKPGLLWAACCSWLARNVAGEPSHVALAWDEVVEVTARGLERYPVEWYAVYRKGLTECWEVPEGRTPHIPDRAVLEVVRSLLHPRAAVNCSSVTVGILRSAGIAVPDGIWNPMLLREWLARQGYRHVRFADTTD